MFRAGKYTGTDNTKKDLQKLHDKAGPIIGDALFEEVRDVEVPECQIATPVLTGNLQSTVRAVGPFIVDKKVSVKVLAGDATSDQYALHVHEDMDANHATGGPKYIERPLKEAAPHMKDRIAKRIDFNKALR